MLRVFKDGVELYPISKNKLKIEEYESLKPVPIYEADRSKENEGGLSDERIQNP